MRNLATEATEGKPKILQFPARPAWAAKLEAADVLHRATRSLARQYRRETSGSMMVANLEARRILVDLQIAIVSGAEGEIKNSVSSVASVAKGGSQ